MNYIVCLNCYRNNIFDKSEILVFSPNINDSVVYKYFTDFYTKSYEKYMIQGCYSSRWLSDVHMKDDLYPNDDGKPLIPILENRIDLPREKINECKKWK